ncbi:hypothetical protein [Allosalinactinospora lopnorensis]|uniref:hypothetical protein n=1 Tax=Allosalinactinospora lopnorensis TaxID=1352348 RepID=UPI000ADDAA09|nr:hypothetical protein [Allosalinactinospora lopnorensis]
MATRLVLHIGVQKSGTTYLQQMLQERARELAEAGVGYPLPPAENRSTGRNYHETATYGLLGTEYPWVSAERAAAERRAWERLLEQVRDWSGTAVVSAEALSVVRGEAVRRVIESLDVADVQVVITARGLGRLLPSAWQQHIRNGRVRDFGAYLDGLADLRDRGWDVVEKEAEAHLWRAYALGRLAERWASVVGTDRVTLVSNPGSPAELLWHRFMAAIGLDGTADRLPAPETGTTVHSGITAAEADVLRSMNATLAAAGWPHEAGMLLRQRIIEDFRARDARGPRLGIPPRYRGRVERWSAEGLDELGESGVRLVGDIGELRYSAAEEPEAPTPADIARAAGTAVSASAAWSDPASAAAPLAGPSRQRGGRLPRLFGGG